MILEEDIDEDYEPTDAEVRLRHSGEMGVVEGTWRAQRQACDVVVLVVGVQSGRSVPSHPIPSHPTLSHSIPQIEEYAQWLGMTSPEDDDLYWIAREV